MAKQKTNSDQSKKITNQNPKTLRLSARATVVECRLSNCYPVAGAYKICENKRMQVGNLNCIILVLIDCVYLFAFPSTVRGGRDACSSVAVVARRPRE